MYCISRYIPESPRWLLVVGKEMEAKNTFVEISRVNNRPLSSGFLLKPPLKPSKLCNFLAFMRNGTLRIRILLLMIEWYRAYTSCMSTCMYLLHIVIKH